ncbi:MAG: FkbM family methyltransferase [Actinomycetota bacterium]|nr:FkbM family methyltransferase [Actinomycetota bacterium]
MVADGAQRNERPGATVPVTGAGSARAVDALRSRATRFRFAARREGAARAAVHYARVYAPGRAPRRLHSPRLDHDVLHRPGSSDAEVFFQICIEDEYAPVHPLPGSAPVIIDCGANVGYSSAYFLSRYPGARVIAVEPDDANVDLLRRNLRPYGDRAEVIMGAVWSHRTRLVCERDPGPRADWAITVREADADERDGPQAFDAVDVAELVERTGAERIDLLKMDIEGAEAVVFGAGDVHRWLDRVDAVAVELHDDTHFGDARGAFLAACGDDFDLVPSGELLIGTRKGIDRG